MLCEMVQNLERNEIRFKNRKVMFLAQYLHLFSRVQSYKVIPKITTQRRQVVD